MSLYNSNTYQSDLLLFVNKNHDMLSKLEQHAVFITGGGGLVCSPIIDILIMYNELYSMIPVDLYVAGRDFSRLRKRFSKYSDREYFHYVEYDSTKRNSLNFDTDYIIHGASNSSPDEIQKHSIDTMMDNIGGIYELLSYADKKKVINTTFISSSEVYGIKNDNSAFVENQYGFIDLLNPRSAYSSSKRASETMCACFLYERDVSSTIIRPGHIYGPTGKRSDKHVCSVFSYSAADGKKLIMKSDGTQIRSWCYSLDSAIAILKVLLEGKRGEAYNISDSHSVASIRYLAQTIAEIAGVDLIYESNVSEADKAAFNPMKNSSLDSTKLEKLGWSAEIGLRKGISHTIDIIHEGKL